jgi:transcriptional regulator with XRE-family HTH domain
VGHGAGRPAWHPPGVMALHPSVSGSANIAGMGDGVASGLLLEARRRAGISQAELARRAGLPRSVLNAYEHRRRQPGADALARVLAAAGFDLRIVPAVRRVDEDRAGRLFAQVLDLAEALPGRRRSRLAYPPLRRRAG